MQNMVVVNTFPYIVFKTSSAVWQICALKFLSFYSFKMLVSHICFFKAKNNLQCSKECDSSPPQQQCHVLVWQTRLSGSVSAASLGSLCSSKNSSVAP